MQHDALVHARKLQKVRGPRSFAQRHSPTRRGPCAAPFAPRSPPRALLSATPTHPRPLQLATASSAPRRARWRGLSPPPLSPSRRHAPLLILCYRTVQGRVMPTPSWVVGRLRPEGSASRWFYNTFLKRSSTYMATVMVTATTVGAPLRHIKPHSLTSHRAAAEPAASRRAHPEPPPPGRHRLRVRYSGRVGHDECWEAVERCELLATTPLPHIPPLLLLRRRGGEGATPDPRSPPAPRTLTWL